MDEIADTPVQASVVYLRIPEFARRPVAEQARLRAQLDAVLAVVMNELSAQERVVLDAADGAVLLVLRRPEAALRLAERVLTASHAGLALAVGINHGAVRFAEDRAEAFFSGDGIATAASVAGFTSTSNMRMSRAFRDALTDGSPGESAGLREAGVFTDAGLRTHELYSPDRARGARLRRLIAAIGMLAILGVAGGSIAYRVLAKERPRPLAGLLDRIEQLLVGGGATLRGPTGKTKR